MTAVAERLYSVEEYLEFERDSLTRHEFLDGRIFAMTGASEPHIVISGNVLSELRSRLRRSGGGRCHVYGPDMRVLCDSGLHTYPDISVCCGEPDVFTLFGTATLRNPEAIVEVLSPSTERYDRGAKFDNYKTIPSLKEYLLVSSDRRRAERFVRESDGRWVQSVFRPPVGSAPPGDADDFPLLTAHLPFTEAYDLVRLPDVPPDPFRVVAATPEEQAADVYPPADPADL